MRSFMQEDMKCTHAHTHTPLWLRRIVQDCVAVITRRGICGAPKTVNVTAILGVINIIVKEDLHSENTK